ncbi:MAG: aminotransferase class V-fold PLP-dependent enzyme [Devosiaceae bacterium]|nr:aminotransferase class V-fold PLP-dependent enzyme [Devosiaceae bacterium]
MPVSKIYLDHNASTSLLSPAHNAMVELMDVTGNPSSVHANGRVLANAIETARSLVGDLAGASREQVVFTGSATEAITQAIVGGVRHFGIGRVVVGATEHQGVHGAAQISGAQVEVLGVDGNGAIDIGALAHAIEDADRADQVLLIAIQWVNNETGVIQDIEKIGKLVGSGRHILFVDGVQRFGKMPIGFDASAIDMMAVSAHKMGGPAGVGALLVKENCNEVRLIPGGGQEQGRRGGTPSAMLIAGFGAAAGAVRNALSMKKLSKWMELFESQVLALGPDVVVFGRKASRLGLVCNFSMPGISSETALIGLDLKGICVSAGSACSSGKIAASKVLEAMGVSPDIANCALRVSAGWNTTKQDIDDAMNAIAQIYARSGTKNEQIPAETDWS